jgi:hypothetical protein
MIYNGIDCLKTNEFQFVMWKSIIILFCLSIFATLYLAEELETLSLYGQSLFTVEFFLFGIFLILDIGFGIMIIVEMCSQIIPVEEENHNFINFQVNE